MTDLTLVLGDLADQHADALVNAANSWLLGGGGVDGAIHARAGHALTEACRELRASQYGRGLATGQSVATTAGRLQALWVIHTVGPRWDRYDDRSSLLASCYRTSLEVAAELGARTVALLAISTGTHRWPLDDAARIAVRTVRETLASWAESQTGERRGAGEGTIEEVRFVLFNQRTYTAFETAMAALDG
ncbi:O-acetyl-ADP-ribose deacetylase [Streptomyces scopuliridis]|uniref:O-acetyl-ADP-ribose deacetylase n=1 Tax=Streptomyces scopuliridis TaxID=452529 RepID=A0ACD4ZFW3_9ACTN|nr:O-acetyl-ADP-ribose deacetylase [Streptomyces scopuliridis]WSB96911.1 O-acetyl-ADP-ribose deacetylase [Streptomyces scopuliridis]WSC09385.1 O-acetyl-ADP-ribose deacetylase [Streptomyces scopuliridis]